MARPNAMQDALDRADERNAAAEEPAAPPARRPAPRREQPDPQAVGALVILGLFALLLAVSMFGRGLHKASPADYAPSAAPTALQSTGAPKVVIPDLPADRLNSAVPTTSNQGEIRPIDCTAEPGAWGCELPPPPPAPPPPAAVAPAPPPAPQPTEPPGWHPPYRSGYSPTENYVEVRP